MKRYFKAKIALSDLSEATQQKFNRIVEVRECFDKRGAKLLKDKFNLHAIVYLIEAFSDFIDVFGTLVNDGEDPFVENVDPRVIARFRKKLEEI